MATKTITNNAGYFRDVTDFRTGQDSAGIDLDYPQVVHRFRADATILKGQTLMEVAPTATVPLSVTPMTAAIGTSDPWMFVGVALHGAAAGEDVDVVVWGYCTVVIEDGDTPASASVLLVPDTTTGSAAVATAGTGSVIGKTLGPEIGTTNTAFCFIGPVVRPDLDVS